MSSDDLIRRQAAINAIIKRDANCGIDSAEVLKNMPSAELPIKEKCCVCPHCDNCDVNEDGTIERKKGEWIPCSERLPKIGEHYVSEPCIVYCSNGAYGFAEIEENIFGQVGWNCERDDEYHEPLGEVLAWMPLPEPYKGD